MHPAHTVPVGHDLNPTALQEVATKYTLGSWAAGRGPAAQWQGIIRAGQQLTSGFAGPLIDAGPCLSLPLCGWRKFLPETHRMVPPEPNAGVPGPNAPVFVDPVCGMTVDPADAGGQFDYSGRTYYFCCEHCLEKFRADPEKYLAAPAAPAAEAEPAAAGGIYICPMHPEVRQEGPGTCPDCGMALEAETPAAEVEANPELADMTRRFWISLVLTVPVAAHRHVGDDPRPARSIGVLRRLAWVLPVLGSNWPSPRPWSSGAGGRSSSGPGPPSAA